MNPEPISFGHADIAENNTGFLFWQLSHIFIQKQDEMLKNIFKISLLHYVILVNIYWLQSHDIEVTQNHLSRRTKIEKMTISKNIQILEERGYISRQSHSCDARANAVSLTSRGVELLNSAVKLVLDVDQKFFSSLNRNIRNFNKELVTLIKNNEKSL